MTELTIANVIADTQLIIKMLHNLKQQGTMTNKVIQVLINGGKIEDIGGYSYGRTSDNDEFILLFSPVKKLEHKICRVYKEQFHQMPWFIPTKDIPQTAPAGNDTRSTLVRQGLFNNCRPFTIATKPGKETQMGPEIRFYIVVDAPPKPVEETKKEKNIVAEKAEMETPDTDTALKNINNMFGLGETQPSHDANDLFDNLMYHDETTVPDSSKTRAIYTIFFGIFHDVPKDSAALAKWYTENKDMVEAKINRTGAE